MLAKLITDRIVVVSEQQRDEICGNFRVGASSQFRVIPLGLDLDVFNQSVGRRQKFRDELQLADDIVQVGIVGRLTEIKNHSLFLEAVHEFKKQFDSSRVRFVIVGDGTLRKRLEEQSHWFGLQDDVIFAGERKDPENFYPAMDVVALTSLNEGTPLTLIEAMANGRAVISTSVGGVVDLLGAVVEAGLFKTCERGLSVAPGDAQSFAAGLHRLVSDATLRSELGTNGFKFVQSNYRKERLLNDIEGLYDDLLKTQATRVRVQSEAVRTTSR
jgi:glycosyltransferase involved in cell wall biosynthesis